VQSQAPGQQPRQGGKHGTIRPVRPRASDLATQHRNLMPEHQDLSVLRGITARQQHKPAEHPDYEQVHKTEQHERRQ
jgi:hypothetical protein